MKLKNLYKPIEEKKPNKFLEESFEDFKKRIFCRNLGRISFLMSQAKDLFENTELKKGVGYQADLYRGGMKVLSLFNHEVTYYKTSELTDFIRLFVKTNPNEPMDLSAEKVKLVIDNSVKVLSDESPFIDSK